MRSAIAGRLPEELSVPNELLYTGTGGAKVRGPGGLACGVRAPAVGWCEVERYDRTGQESRLPSTGIDRPLVWPERVADLLRAAPRSNVPQAVERRRRTTRAR